MQINSHIKLKITERILLLLDSKGITKYKFHKDLGLSNGFLDKKRDIGTDKYANILDYLANIDENINPDWLLTGRGEMLKENNGDTKRAPPDKVACGNCQVLEERLKEKERIIEAKDEIIALLKQQASNRDNTEHRKSA